MDSNTDMALNGVSSLSVSAKPFVPNVHATTFVPSFAQKSVTPSQPPPPQASQVSTPVEETKNVEADDTSDNWEDNVDDVQDESNETNEKPVEEETNKETNEEEKPDKSQVISKPKKDSKPPTPEPGDGKENINIIFIGHVDAGKSTIGGQLLFLTGQVDKRTLEKYEREAKEKNRETWYLSWALDTNLEERDKGKTVECGRASFDTESKHFVLLDAPGHKSFVPNMIGGAAQADVAVLVISARKGEFETGFERGGQTREHAMLAKTAGVKYLIILVNKMDDPTVEWAESRYQEVTSKLTPYLKKTGFKPSEMTFMPCSGFTGANLKDKVDASVCSWYNGKSFLDHLDTLPDFEWPFDEPVKVLISERYKDMGTIVIAKVESGTVRKGDSYMLMPNKHTVKIVAIVGADENEKNTCRAGENVKLKLSGVEEDEVLPGFVLSDPSALCNTGQVFDAQIVILEHKSIICAGYKAVLHIHNAVEEVTLVGLISTINRKTGEKSTTRPRFIKQDTIAIARFKTANLICMETFQAFAPMGRFTLRDEGKTIAIGKVLNVRHKKEQAD
ncbi:eukaryotic peptide chain release factor GTP-binding subunit ERF3A-like isoform X2 [Hydractinia symbiolongicarpus]|uniref:eukaryotic peptide chain release factor GTP-binding subunit ERF3A-like isoform X2 n=1 Tax=Hydractinia symbiolongicarpus TaxID=13093 RepID=UPI00254E1720|nr:eukaryotic peptide chain release factor GTP-binding subunit ERF3A-like isoform X2 [Hydractinia symbiolongicarpus]